MKNPFWKGYLKHLVTDLVLYRALDIETRFKTLWENIKKHTNVQDLYAVALERLHNDWDILNKVYINHYNISLPDEVIALNVVGFRTGELAYVNKTVVDTVISLLNQVHLY